MADYGTLPPNIKGNIERFEIRVEEQQLQDFKTLLRLSPIVQETYENQKERVSEGNDFGITREWLVDAKSYWEKDYNWYAACFILYSLFVPSEWAC